MTGRSASGGKARLQTLQENEGYRRMELCSVEGICNEVGEFDLERVKCILSLAMYQGLQDQQGQYPRSCRRCRWYLPCVSSSFLASSVMRSPTGVSILTRPWLMMVAVQVAILLVTPPRRCRTSPLNAMHHSYQKSETPSTYQDNQPSVLILV